VQGYSAAISTGRLSGLSILGRMKRKSGFKAKVGSF
jgi:hypothetical protein